MTPHNTAAYTQVPMRDVSCDFWCWLCNDRVIMVPLTPHSESNRVQILPTAKAFVSTHKWFFLTIEHGYLHISYHNYHTAMLCYVVMLCYRCIVLLYILLASSRKTNNNRMNIKLIMRALCAQVWQVVTFTNRKR